MSTYTIAESHKCPFTGDNTVEEITEITELMFDSLLNGKIFEMSYRSKTTYNDVAKMVFDELGGNGSVVAGNIVFTIELEDKPND